MQDPSLHAATQAQAAFSPVAAGPSAPALNPTKALLDGGEMSVNDILDLPREQRCPFPSGDPEFFNKAGRYSQTLMGWKKQDYWKNREYMDIVCTGTNEYKLFCFNCTLKTYADPSEADNKRTTNKWIVDGFELDYCKIENNRKRDITGHEDSEDHKSATAWIVAKRSESQSNKKLKPLAAPHHIVQTTASVENEVEKANIKRKINETNAWAEEQVFIIRRFSKTGTIEDFAKSIEFGVVGKEALHELRRVMQTEDKNKLESWCEQWAKDLSAERTTLVYEKANRLDACRKVALEWLYGVANLCYDFKERSYKPAWGEDGKHVKEMIKAKHVMPLLDRCLFMDRAKALYFMNFHWYSEDQAKTLDYSNPHGGSINKRYKWILEDLLLEEDTTRYSDLFEPTKIRKGDVEKIAAKIEAASMTDHALAHSSPASVPSKRQNDEQRKKKNREWKREEITKEDIKKIVETTDAVSLTDYALAHSPPVSVLPRHQNDEPKGSKRRKHASKYKVAEEKPRIPGQRPAIHCASTNDALRAPTPPVPVPSRRPDNDERNTNGPPSYNVGIIGAFRVNNPLGGGDSSPEDDISMVLPSAPAEPSKTTYDDLPLFTAERVDQSYAPPLVVAEKVEDKEAAKKCKRNKLFYVGAGIGGFVVVGVLIGVIVVLATS